MIMFLKKAVFYSYRFLSRVIGYIIHPKETWFVWRLSRYLKLRSKKIDREIALKKTFLSADKLALKAGRQLDVWLSSVVIFTINCIGQWESDSALDYCRFYLRLIEDLAPVVSPSIRPQLAEQVRPLIHHTWGGIQRPAELALQQLTAVRTPNKA